jgi:hypothetical protein
MHDFSIKKESTWEFKTAGSGGLGWGPVAGEGGLIRVKDPHKNLVDFYFGGLGVGWSHKLGIPKNLIKLPKIRGKEVTGTIVPTFYKNWGYIYILNTFKGDELSPSDIAGACMYVEGAGGLYVGYSGTAMLLGMNPLLLAAALAVPPTMFDLKYHLLKQAYKTATCVLLMHGFTSGAMAGAGVNVYVGYLGQEKAANEVFRKLREWLRMLEPKPAPPSTSPPIFGNYYSSRQTNLRPVIREYVPAGRPQVSSPPPTHAHTRTHANTQKAHRHMIPVKQKKCFPDWQPLEGFPGWYWYFDGETPHFTDSPTRTR